MHLFAWQLYSSNSDQIIKRVSVTINHAERLHLWRWFVYFLLKYCLLSQINMQWQLSEMCTQKWLGMASVWVWGRGFLFWPMAECSGNLYVVTDAHEAEIIYFTLKNDSLGKFKKLTSRFIVCCWSLTLETQSNKSNTTCWHVCGGAGATGGKK